ncbi:MAG: histidine kinase dimerization/phospho-acceptor domain-containing protein, partial [Spirochaetota bacterium]
IAIKTIIHALLIYLIINLILYFLIIKVEKILTIDLTRQYIHIKYLIEGKYNNNEVISKISEIDNIRYGLNNLITILKERREFYSSLILFQKKVLDLIPVGVIIFNEKGLFEDANTFGYAQIEREVKKNNIDLTDLNSILVEKFSIDSIIANESLNFLNQNNVVELKLKPSITISKRVFGKIVGDKKIILLVPLNFSTEEEKDDNTLILNQTLAPFISDFAHELRSPLNSILGFSQIIKDGVEGDNLEEIKNDGKIINESGQIMMTFIDDIIFLSRLGLKKIESLYVSFDLTLLFTLMNYYFKGIFKNKDTIFVLPQNIENKEIISDFQNIRRILLLFLFYLRSLFPLPIKIEMNFESMENDFYSINIFYFFDKENIISQRNSKIIFDFCNQISKDSSLEIYNEIKGKNGI